jgi:hypothetical protein
MVFLSVVMLSVVMLGAMTPSYLCSRHHDTMRLSGGHLSKIATRGCGGREVRRCCVLC